MTPFYENSFPRRTERNTGLSSDAFKLPAKNDQS